MTLSSRFTVRRVLLGLLLCACACLAILPTISNAQTSNCVTGTSGFVPLVCVSGSSKLGNLYSSPDLSNFIEGLFTFAISLGAILAVLRLSYAGYLYMGQSDMWSSKGKARAIIGEVILGLLLLLSIWLILNQINPTILQFKAFQNIQPVTSSSAGKAGN